MALNTKDAQQQLNVDFMGDTTATIPFAAGKIQVRVTDNHDPGRPIQGAQVKAKDGATELTQETDVNGVAAFEIPNLGSAQKLFVPRPITVEASKNGFKQSTQTITIVAIATIDVRFMLAPQ